MSATKRNSRYAVADMLKSTKSFSSMPSKKKKQSTLSDDDVPVISPDDRILIEQKAMRQNQAQISDIADVLRSLVNMAEEEDLKVPSSQRPTGALDNGVATTASSVEVMQNIMVGVKNRRGDYVNSIARSEGSLSLGPALRHRQIDRRIAECVSLLCKISPSANDDVQYVGHVLLVANPAESLETIYHKQLKSSTEIYSGVRELCAQIGDIIARVQDTQDTGRSSNDLKAQAGFNITAITPMLRRSVREVRDAIASQVVIGSASLDLCCVLRKSMEELEQDNRSLQYAKMVLTRQLREAYLDNVVVRSELHDKFLSSRQAEIQANARMNTAMKKSAHPKVLVMCQIENTYSRKLHRPRMFSEALMEVLHWMDMKLPVMQGKRVNYNSALEPKDVYDVDANPMLPPESYFLEFPSIGPAIEFCVALQQDMALAIDWPATLLKIPCFEEVKDGLQGGTAGEESALQRSRRVSHQRPIWNGLRMRTAIHIGLPYVTHPFRGASPIFALPNAASKPEADITPEDVPHLMGMAVDATMQLLKKARGGEILISAKASEAYDALKFQHPDSFTNVFKIPRDYSGNKGLPGKGNADDDTPFSQGSEGSEEGDMKKDLSMVPSGSMPKPSLERHLSDHSFTGKTFVRPCDRVYAVISHLLKSREETFYPYHYNEVSEVVFPPTAWWRSTDAQSSNLSLFASIGGKAEDMPSDMEDLSEEEEEYIPPDAVEDPHIISVASLNMAPSLGRFEHASGRGGGGGLGEDGGGRMSVSFLEKANTAASIHRGSGSSGGKKKRRTAAEYESELERLYSQIDGLNGKCREQDEIKSMFAEEIQLLQSKNQSLTDNLNSAKKALSKSRKRHATCAYLLTQTSNSVMESEEIVSNLVASNEALKAKIKTLITEMDELDTRLSVSIASQRESVQKAALLSSWRVNGECQTGPDPNLALEAARGDILEKALRWSISLLSLSSQHIEMITHPSSTTTATGNMVYKRSIVTSDIHKKVTSFLEDPTVAAAIATVDDRFEPLGSMKLVSDKSRTKSNRVDDLIRTVRKFHTDQVGIEKDRPDDPFAKTINPVIVSKKSAGGNDYDSYDWSAPLNGLTIYESLRHAAGHVLKGVTDVMSFDQLLQARHQKVQMALTRAVASKDDATLSSDVSMVIARHLRGAGAEDGDSQLTTPTAPNAPDMSFTAQRARDAEGKVKDQGDVILQYRTELARTGKEIEEVRVAREVEQLRAEVMYGKLKEVNAVLNGLRETIISAVAKINKEIPNASLIKSKIMSTAGGENNGSSSNLTVSVSMSVAEQEANMEFLLSKVLSDLQGSLGATVIDFCTQAGNAGPPLSSRRNTSIITVGSGLGGSVQGDGTSSVGEPDTSLGDLSIMSSSIGLNSPNNVRPTGGVSPQPHHIQRERAISNVITHDLDLATIMYRSKNELEMSSTLPEGVSPLKQLTQIELFEKDRHRLLNLQKQFDSRMERIKEKEKNRLERDAQLQAADWAVVIEKQYKREKYLLDQVRHLIKRRAAMEQSERDTQKGKMERSCQTTILAEHRMFKKHDEAVAKGVDEAEEENKINEAKRDLEFQALLTTMRRAEREQQTDMSCFARRSCKVQTRRRATDFVDDEEDEDYCISIDSEFEVSENDFGFMNSPPSSPSHSESISATIKSERKRQSLIRTKLRNFRKTRGGKAVGGGPTENGAEETVNKFGRKTKNMAVMTTPRLGAADTTARTAAGDDKGHRSTIGARQNLTQMTSSHSITNPAPISRPTQSKVHNVNLSEASGSSIMGARTLHNSTSPDSSIPPSKTASSQKFLKRGDKSTSSISSVMSAKAAAKKLASNAKSNNIRNIGSSSSSAPGGTPNGVARGVVASLTQHDGKLLDIASDDEAQPNVDDSSMSDQERSAILAFGSGVSLLETVTTHDVPPSAFEEKDTNGSFRIGGSVGGLPSIPDIGSTSTRSNTAKSSAPLSNNFESAAAESDDHTTESPMTVVRSALSQSQSLRIAEPALHVARGRFDSISAEGGLKGDITMNDGTTPREGTNPLDSLDGEDRFSLSQANPDLPDAFPSDTSTRNNRSTMGSASGRPRTQRQFGDSLTDNNMEEVPGFDHGSFAAMQDSLLRVVEDKVSSSPSKPHQRNRLAGRVFTPQAQVQSKVNGRGPTMVPFLLEPPKELAGQYTMHTQQFDLSHLDASIKNSKSVAYAQLLQDLSQNPELKKEMEGVQKGMMARRLYESKVRDPSSPSNLMMASSTPTQDRSYLHSRPLSGLDPSSSYYRHSVSSTLAVPTSTGGKVRVRTGTVTSLDHTKLTPKDQQLFQHPAVGNEEFARRHKSFSEENYEHSFERRNSPPQSPLDASTLRPLRNPNGSLSLEPNVHGRPMVHVAPQTAPSFVSEPVLVPAGRVHTTAPPLSLGKRCSSASTPPPPPHATTSPTPTKLTPIPQEALKERLTSAAKGRESRSFSLVQRKTELGIGGKQQQ